VSFPTRILSLRLFSYKGFVSNYSTQLGFRPFVSFLIKALSLRIFPQLGFHRFISFPIRALSLSIFSTPISVSSLCLFPYKGFIPLYLPQLGFRVSSLRLFPFTVSSLRGSSSFHPQSRFRPFVSSPLGFRPFVDLVRLIPN
jgi:hypothetical protein